MMETRILMSTSSTSNGSNYDEMMLNRKESSVHHHHQRTTSSTGTAIGGGHHHHHQTTQLPPPLTAVQMRPHSTPATLLWLEENYEMAQGVCVPRNTLYLHYVDFCSKHGMTPVNAASFGKIIRQQFPQLTTRRLGTRGQSRYHYYGIAIRENSAYYELVYSKKGLQATEDIRKDHLRQMPSSCAGNHAGMPSSSRSVTSSSSSSQSVGGGIPVSVAVAQAATAAALATRLPEFPNLRDLCLPPGGISGGVPEERVATFIVMYRAHCQRLLDTIIRGSFQEVQTFLLHYWQGMPPHLVGVLGSHVVVNIVGVCDSILYRSVCSILMSSVIRGLPENLIQMIRKFASELESWLQAALDDLPENLRAVKIDLARHFCHMLRRQSSLNQLFGTVRLALHDPQVNSVLLHDWQRQDIHAMTKSALQAASNFHLNDQGQQFRKRRSTEAQSINPATVEFVAAFGGEFERLLAEQAPLEAYTEWVESIVDRCVLQQRGHHRSRPASSLRHSIRQFLLVWMAFSGRLLRELTAQTAAGFETFHLMRIMVDDYFLYLVELLHVDDRARELMRNITLDIPPEYLDTDYEGFLATVFANLDISPELNSLGSDHPSSGNRHLTVGEPHYADVVTEETSHMENNSPNIQQQQVIVVNNATTNNGYNSLPTESTSDTGTSDETFTSYDYATNIRLANGYKFTSGGGPTNTGGYNSYPASNTPPAVSHQQLSYYPSTGFGDVTTAAEQYTNGSYNAAYQHAAYHIRRDFSTDVIHHQVHSCSTSGGVGSSGFYSSEHQQSPQVITPTTGTNYVNIPATAGTGDYYGTVYDVTSSASSSSSASVYGDLNDQNHPKLKKNETVIAQQSSSVIIGQTQPDTECGGKAPETNTSSNFHISSEPYIRS
ncbi:transcription factor RFX4 [Daphnia magna]|uniref:transcription factor RFX4 n=1 Tax=Daphnia magna TaxID=35525 RepID=UPI001E1BC217|nr:transcription factor RFX4 [Daphnia magna]XP_032794287.2 transcription factor RFX4 [Daphnia magna]XP_045034733.1 transcription factor RFX4 [Daphnia magna]XP_045034734.1 transcription factor RFX4 [Daphnia magna]